MKLLFDFIFGIRKSSSLPLPPPPTISDDGTVIVQPEMNSNENESSTSSSTPMEKPKYFFAPLKSKRKMSTSSSSTGTAAAIAMATDGKTEMRPDVLLVNNVIPSDGNNRLATIRKPHNPLKYPSNTNAASIDPEVSVRFRFLSSNISF